METGIPEGLITQTRRRRERGPVFEIRTESPVFFGERGPPEVTEGHHWNLVNRTGDGVFTRVEGFVTADKDEEEVPGVSRGPA